MKCKGVVDFRPDCSWLDSPQLFAAIVLGLFTFYKQLWFCEEPFANKGPLHRNEIVGVLRQPPVCMSTNHLKARTKIKASVSGFHNNVYASKNHGAGAG